MNTNICMCFTVVNIELEIFVVAFIIIAFYVSYFYLFCFIFLFKKFPLFKKDFFIDLHVHMYACQCTDVLCIYRHKRVLRV